MLAGVNDFMNYFIFMPSELFFERSKLHKIRPGAYYRDNFLSGSQHFQAFTELPSRVIFSLLFLIFLVAFLVSIIFLEYATTHS